MSVHPKTRAAVSSRWIRAATAAFVLATGASLLAQENKDKDKRTPPAAHKSTPSTPPAKGGEQPAVHTANPPANTPAARPAYGSQPANTPPPRPAYGTQPANTPAPRPAYGDQPANTPAARPTYGAPPAQNERPPRPVGGNPAPANGTAPGHQFGAGGNPTAGHGPTGTPPRNVTPSAAMPGGNRPVYHGENGSEVHYRSNGQPQMVRAHGMTITHSPSGVQRAEFVRPDHSVIVTHGAHYGYVQRPYVVNNVSYVQRTYVVGGRSYARVYRPYLYHGVSLNLYVSSRYYAPAYYGWAYSPWSTPVVFSFGWGRSPWFGYYGGYFTPYPTYAGPAYWLTDYMIAMTLQDAYQQRMDAAAAAQANAQYGGYQGSQAALTPDVKDAIAGEVHRQLDQERAESQGAPMQDGPQFLADNSTHVFVVGSGLDVQSRSGECALTEGDVLQMTAPPPPNSAMADLAVLASKGQDCRKGSVVSIAIPDLQEMQNHMRETLDQGLADLQTRQGQGGIPAPPAAAQRPPVEAPYASAAPPPDPNVATELSQQSEYATQAESEVLDQAQAPPAAPSSAPTSVTLGLTIDQVVAILGQPKVVGDLGSKKTYFYGNMKVIFTDGKVTDIQ